MAAERVVLQFGNSVKEIGMERLALRALGLVIIVPALLIVYLFRGDIAGKEASLLAVLLLSLLGFHVVWSVLRAVNLVQVNLGRIVTGESKSFHAEESPKQLREMSEIIASLNNLTLEFRENAAQLERFIQQFATLTELTEITAKVPDIKDLLNLVLRKAMATTHASRGTVMLLREDGKEYEIVAAEGWIPDPSKPIRAQETLAQKVLDNGMPLLVENIESDQRFESTNNAERYSTASFLIMPLKTKAGTVGVVCLSEKATKDSFAPQDQQFMTVLLGQIGFAVENARLLKHAREAASDLKRTVEDQEIQIEHAQDKIREAEKLSALGQLAGGIAHDFNNIIQAILGYTQRAQETTSSDQKLWRDLEQVRIAAGKAASLTGELLAFGRRQVLQKSDQDIRDVVGNMIEMLTRLLGDHVDLEVCYTEDPCVVHVDPRQIEQVLLNLCINARDALRHGGKISIETQAVCIEEEPSTQHAHLEPGNYALLKVADTGIGMDESTRKQIFEPFFTTKEVGKGTGLGLATAYGIVQQHLGLIEVASEVGEGTTFYVYLPAVDRPASPQPKSLKVHVEPGTETILVAEDEEAVRRLCAGTLEKAGYTVLQATDGREAAALFEKHQDEIDLAVLDVVMPKMNGCEVTKAIRAMSAEVGIVLCSGYGSDVLDMAFIEQEGVVFLQKPYESHALLHLIRDVLDGRTATGSRRVA